MALAKIDYDAQAAEEAFTRLRASFQGGGPLPKDDAWAAVHSVAVYAAIAQAHALERIAQALEALHRDYLPEPDSLKRTSPTHTVKKP